MIDWPFTGGPERTLRPRGKTRLDRRCDVRRVGMCPRPTSEPGDPLLAHRSDEFVTLGELDVFAEVLS
jgi:hypothetical protein